MIEPFVAAAATLALDFATKRIAETRLTQRGVALSSAFELKHVSSRRPLALWPAG